MLARTLTLREAVHINDFGHLGSLEQVIRALHPNPTTAQERTAPAGPSFVQCRSLLFAADHVLMHLVGYTPDDLIQVLPVAGQDVQLAEAPPGMEILDGESMLHIRGNSVLVCRCGLPDGALMSYVVFRRASLALAQSW